MIGVMGAVAVFAIVPLVAGGARRMVAWSTAAAYLLLLGVASAAPEWSTLDSAPASFLAVSAGFVLLGVTLWVAGRGSSARAYEQSRLSAFGPSARRVGEFFQFAAIVVLAYVTWPLLRIASWRGPVAALGLGVSGVVLAFAFRWLKVSERIQRVDDRWLARSHPATSSDDRRVAVAAWVVFVAALLAVIAAHGLCLVTVAAVAAVVAAHLLTRRAGKGSPFPLRPIVAALSLFAFYFAVRTIAGSDIALHFPGILETPFSDAAEAALALVVGLGAWMMIGLWPFHGAGAGSAAAIVGGAFLIRWGNGLIPDGMMHAAPIFAIVAMVAALHASATGRVGEFAGALGVLAVTAHERGAWAFFGIASCLAVVRLVPKEAMRVPLCPPGLDRRQFGAILLIPALAVTLPWMLRGEAFQAAVAMVAGVPLALSLRD